jgi:hypothetical protein
MRFEARWDGKLRATTVAITAVLAIVAGVLLVLGWRDRDPTVAVLTGGIALGFAAIVLASRALAPIGFAVEGSEVKVLRRRARPLVIPLSRVRAAGPYGTFLGAIRLGGSGGLFGWYGRHWSRALGQFRLYATRTLDLVQLDTPEGRWILSPDQPERFLQEVLARAPAAELVPAQGPHARHPLPRAAWLRLAALLAIPLVLVGAVVLVSAAWAPRGVAVDRWSIQIQRRWVEPLEIPISSVRAVEVLGRERIGQVRKVTSFSDGSGAVWGRFRSDVLGEFRLYSWRRGCWVLVETGEERVVLTPGDPDRFVADVREGLARSRP